MLKSTDHAMKTKQLLLVLLLIPMLALLACEKESIDAQSTEDVNVASIEGGDEPLIGSWELRSSQGGYRDATLPPPDFSSGNGTILKFTATQYFQYAKGQLTRSGTYTVTKETSFINNKPMYRIIYDGKQTNTFREFFEIKGDKLIIYAGAPISLDGIEMTFQKQ